MRGPVGLTMCDWVAGRALPIAFWSLLLTSQLLALTRQITHISRFGTEGTAVLELIRGLLTMGFFVMVLAAYFSRFQVVARAVGFREKVLPMLVFLAAPAGIFLLLQLDLPPAFDVSWVGVGISVVGLLLSLWALWHLRSSFSILAEARNPVTSGPYRFVRHPLYLGEAMTMLGLCLLMGTWVALLLWSGVNAFQLLRARIEEEKLSQQFPDYRLYRSRTRFILPGVF